MKRGKSRFVEAEEKKQRPKRAKVQIMQDGKERDCMSDVTYDEELYKKFFGIVGSAEEGKRISQTKAAMALNYSPAVVSSYKNRTYAGDIKRLEEKIREYILRDARRLTLVNVPTAKTSILEQVQRTVTIAQDEAEIAVIIGETGGGKTTALRQHTKENYSALMIEVDPSFSKGILMQKIAQALGVEPKGSTSVITERIISALQDRDAVLIIDEADYLSDASLELLRRIHDKAHTGLVLVGLPRLEYQIKNYKKDHQQLQSRVSIVAKLSKLSKDDAKKILSGVWTNLSKDIIDIFIKTANGSTRTLVKLMVRVHQTMALNRAETPNADIISAAGELLMR